VTNEYIQKKIVELKFSPDQVAFLEKVAAASYERGVSTQKEILKKSIEKYLLPNKNGDVEGYGGNYEREVMGDPFNHKSWSDGYDCQHAAIDIWEANNK
jgi:hypothetical protein